MPYLIQTLDRPGKADLRQALESEHRAWLDTQSAHILAAGALLQDDGSELGGGLYIIDAESRTAAQAFINDDPLTKAGLFASTEITRWRKAFLNFHNFLLDHKGV